VVCSTNSTAGSDLLEPANPDEETSSRIGTFDTLVIDEATQATAPSCWIPMMHARRAILVGDHKQLPPTILNREAAESGLQYTLFERLARHHETDPEKPDSIRSLLRTQYRMHETIMGFSSRRFYDDRLEADDTVRYHTLADLGVTTVALPDDTRRDILDPEAPLVFVDTSGIDAPERQRAGSHSRENPREATIVTQLAADLIDAGVAPDQIAVIAPYDDQVDRLEQKVAAGVEVDTVDGFQGREKEVVLVSLVRSNDRGEIGFLDEPRRFNVAVTRAKRKVVVVGDTNTVTSGDVFDAVVRYAEDEGSIVRL
jgi:predicted DNA helicase